MCQFGGAAPNTTIAGWKCVDSNAGIDTAATTDPASYQQLGACKDLDTRCALVDRTRPP